MRDAYEHWSKRDKRAKHQIDRLTGDPLANQWRLDGSGTLGHLVDDDALKRSATAVYEELVGYDPPAPAVV